ncbi:MAG: MlaD family protein [Microscillaceae bacterium]|jgi:phospholipid/cholesterol/gamma-HCH transport system substrate-binding protein|nr:MlaD family protein [Microscillaceae bacterium]
MTKEFKIGLLALIASIMLYTGFNFLKGTDFFSSTKRYYVVYDDINGLTISNPVMVNGLSVGRVSSIEVLQKDNNKLKVTLDVRDDITLGEKTEAWLSDAGLLGGKQINLIIHKNQKNFQGGETLIAKIQEGMVKSISNQATPLANKVDTVLNQAVILTKALVKSKDDIAASLSNVSGITGKLNNTLGKGEIDQIIHNVNALSASLVAMQKQFQPIVGKMDNFADKLNKMELETAVKQANESMQNLNQILAKVNKGEGTLGALANNDSLYQNLNNVTNSTNRLLIDMRENPKRYVNISVFGKKEKK